MSLRILPVPGMGADCGVLFLLNHLLRYDIAMLSFRAVRGIADEVVADKGCDWVPSHLGTGAHQGSWRVRW